MDTDIQSSIEIWSGGQTGVDRGALDAAMDMDIPVSGWCPKGRLAEDGVIADRYPLIETGSSAYPVRTQKNVYDTDGTLILTYGRPTKGTKLTITIAAKAKKPVLQVDLIGSRQNGSMAIRRWVTENKIGLLNVAGPRASTEPSDWTIIHNLAYDMIQEFLVPFVAK